MPNTQPWRPAAIQMTQTDGMMMEALTEEMGRHRHLAAAPPSRLLKPGRLHHRLHLHQAPPSRCLRHRLHLHRAPPSRRLRHHRYRRQRMRHRLHRAPPSRRLRSRQHPAARPQPDVLADVIMGRVMNEVIDGVHEISST